MARLNPMISAATCEPDTTSRCSSPEERKSSRVAASSAPSSPRTMDAVTARFKGSLTCRHANFSRSLARSITLRFFPSPPLG